MEMTTIYNPKTQTRFEATTRVDRNGLFKSLVIRTRLQNGLAKSSKLEWSITGAPTRYRAMKLANQACKSIAENHAFVN